MLRSFLISWLLFLFLISYSQIASGPMVGYASMREVCVWVQTQNEAKVALLFKPVGRGDYNSSEPVMTNHEHGYTAHLIAEALEPGLVYEYIIEVDGNKINPKNTQTFKTKPLWQWRTDAPDFSFVAGSCMYVNDPPYDRPGTPYGGEYQIFENIHKDKPDFMVWLGDNTYTREADWDSKFGIYHRYRHSRALEQLQPLLASTSHYAIWDDHDYGPNDIGRHYWNKNLTKQAFQDFWANQNIGVGDTEGISSYFDWSDANFFLLDDRWYRSPDNFSSPTILGDRQLKWLCEALLYSKASFKFVAVGGQFLNDAREFENFSNFVSERKKIIDFINEHNIKNVVFLTGDRHFSEVSKLQTAKGITIYDITSSSLTSKAQAHEEEQNTLRIKGSHIGVRNYALINISGKKNERNLHLSFKNSDGVILYEYDIKQE